MSHLRFDGQGAGLNKRMGGNANSASDYTLICTCETELGVLARYFPNDSGARSVFCPRCHHITIVNAEGQVTAYVLAPKEIIAKAVSRST